MIKNISISTFVNIIFSLAFVSIFITFAMFLNYDKQKHEISLENRYELIAENFLSTFQHQPTKESLIASFKPDEKVKIQIERDGKDIELNIVLGDRTTSLAETPTPVNNNIFLGGLKLSTIDSEMQKKFRLSSDTSGILISDVEVKSKAEKAGFQAGDIIIQIEDIEIKNFSNVEMALKKYENKFKRVYVNRYGQTILFITQ